METVCFGLCFLSACLALLVGSCHGSIQNLQYSAGATANYVLDWNNVSEVNYKPNTTVSDKSTVTNKLRHHVDSSNNFMKNFSSLNISDEIYSLFSETKYSTIPIQMEQTTTHVKEIVTFPITGNTTITQTSDASTTETHNRKNNDGKSSGTETPFFITGRKKYDHINADSEVTTDEFSKSIPKPENLISTSTDFEVSTDSNPNQFFEDTVEYEFDWQQENNSSVSNYDAPCDKYLSVAITEYQIFGNGSVLATDNYPMMYPPQYIWKDTDENNNTVLRGCLCLLTNCLRKCCDENMVHTEERCARNNNSLYVFQPQFIDMDTLDVIKNNSNDIQIVYGNPCEHGSYRIDPLDENYPEPFWLKPDGILLTGEVSYSAAEYCMEMFEDVGRVLPLLCFPPEEEEEPQFVTEDTNVYMMYPVGMIISLPFLLATFCIYACIHELRNLHGKSLMCHVMSLFSAYVFLAIVQLGGHELEITFCKICAFVIYFAFHASFFWLNVMCFDIWWTFSGLRPLRGSVKEREYKKFVMYSIYAWGSPLIMLIVCLLMDLVPGIPNDYIKPEFGKEKCWFSTKTGDLAYFFGPIGIIVLCNIFLFIATAIRLIQLKKETKMLKGGESKRHDDESERQRFNLYLKLFVVMGVNWIMEVISWIVGGPEYLWYITDLGNTLQGVLIFIIFVWKRKIRRLLAKKFCPKLAHTSIYEGSVKSRHTASRTSSINNTYRTSISNQDQLVLKPLPDGAYRVSEIP